ncbi:MAG TPA: hypothetical protein VGK48_04525 [Terriglobia bacterium]|jgi:hypothetical protein
MKPKIFIAIVFVFFVVATSISTVAQETVYPIPPNSDPPALLTEDHYAFVVERSFEYKLTFGYPSMDKAWFIPGTKTRLVVLWLKVENESDNPLKLDVSKFISTDDTGKTYTPLTADEAFNRIMAGVATTEPTIASKTLKGISFGKAGNKVTAEQIKEDVARYALLSGTLPPRSVKDGLIYFDPPKKKKFMLTVNLGDLWARPFVFSTSKPK